MNAAYSLVWRLSFLRPGRIFKDHNKNPKETNDTMATGDIERQWEISPELLFGKSNVITW